MKVVVSPGRMLKFCQLMTELCEANTFSCAPFCVTCTEPLPTLMPPGFATATWLTSPQTSPVTQAAPVPPAPHRPQSLESAGGAVMDKGLDLGTLFSLAPILAERA